jgi:hypothetical protein
MKHRHLDTTRWTLAAIDSALERGGLPDWRELFDAARRDRAVAERILHVANQPKESHAAPLARELVLGLYPDLNELVLPRVARPVG